MPIDRPQRPPEPDSRAAPYRGYWGGNNDDGRQVYWYEWLAFAAAETKRADAAARQCADALDSVLGPAPYKGDPFELMEKLRALVAEWRGEGGK
jgi:hypothetical protein